jgi:hypothetical protein
MANRNRRAPFSGLNGNAGLTQWADIETLQCREQRFDIKLKDKALELIICGLIVSIKPRPSITGFDIPRLDGVIFRLNHHWRDAHREAKQFTEASVYLSISESGHHPNKLFNLPVDDKNIKPAFKMFWFQLVFPTLKKAWLEVYTENTWASNCSGTALENRLAALDT